MCLRPLALSLLLIVSACAPSLKHQQEIEQNLLSHQYTAADQVVVKHRDRYGQRDIVLYYMDRGMVLHLAGRYRESNTFFEKADAEIERLYTQSLVTNVGALLTNDNLLPYEGEDFEKVLITLFSALNYAALSEWDEALVEARRVDAKLNRLNDRHTKKNIYKEDAFARYLSGVLYEARGEINDAFISYRKAFDTFKTYQQDYHTPIPARLGLDLLRVTDDLHLEEEYESYVGIFPEEAALYPLQPSPKKSGEIIVLAYTGRSPIKEDFFITAPIPDGEDGTYLLRIAMPKFIARPSRVSTVDITLRKGRTIVKKRLDLLQDITAIAKKNLGDRIARITAKAIARATSKYIATRTARRKFRKEKEDRTDLLIGLIGNIYTFVTEQSDKRSWRTLPGRIYMGRVSLSEGKWKADVRFFSQGGGLVETRHSPILRVKNGKKAFLITQTLH